MIRAIQAVLLAMPIPIAAAVAGYLYLHGEVTGASLSHSVQREAGSETLVSAGGNPCDRQSATRWRCMVSDSAASGTAVYRIDVHDGSCYRGRLVGDVSDPMPRRIEGCVLLRD